MTARFLRMRTLFYAPAIYLTFLTTATAQAL